MTCVSESRSPQLAAAVSEPINFSLGLLVHKALSCSSEYLRSIRFSYKLNPLDTSFTQKEKDLTGFYLLLSAIEIDFLPGE